MKKIYRLLFTMLISLIFVSNVYGENKYVGTCYCYNQYTVRTEKVNCSDYTNLGLLSDYVDNGYGGICEVVCEKHGGYKWYNDFDLRDLIKDTCEDGVNCDPVTDETLKDCVLDEGNENSCKYSYSKEACSTLENGKWNEETNCCDLEKKCWLHLEIGSRSEGGTLYYQEESPCADPANKEKYPNQKCTTNSLSEEKCTGHSYPHDVDEEEHKTAPSYTKFKPIEFLGGIFGRNKSCSETLGSNGVKILNGIITALRIGAAIVAIINAMIILIPAVTSKDADGLKKASQKCVKLAVVLAVIEILPSVIKLIGALFSWDVCGIK